MSKNGISERLLIEKLMNFAEEHGRTPTAIEFGYPDQIKRLFGSYRAFVKSQGFDERIGENELSEEIHDFVKANGHLPKRYELKYEHLIYKYYGSFVNFIKAHGYENLYLSSHGKFPSKSSPTTVKDCTTKKTLNNKLKKFVKEHGRTPTMKEFGNRGDIYKIYGSYLEFIKISGYESLYIRSQVSKEKLLTSTDFDESFAKTILTNRLDSFVAEYDRVPSATELGHFDQITKYYGSYDDFLKSQGLAREILDKNVVDSKNELVRKLKTFILINERVPKSSEFGYEKEITSLFGSFETFLKENGQ